MKRLTRFMLLLALAMPWTAKAQSGNITFTDTNVVVTIGDETSNYTYANMPVVMYYNYSLTQQIYTAAELGNTAGIITSIAFDYAYTETFSMAGMKVYMKNINKTSFDSDTDMVDLSDATMVYDGSFAASEAGWVTLQLQTPFFYNGTSNLLLCCYDPTNGYPGYDYKFRSTPADGPYCYLSYFGDNAIPDLNDISSYSASKFRDIHRNNIRLTFNTNIQSMVHDDFPYVDDFTTASGWQLINGDLTNPWVWGEAGNRGDPHIYISDNNGTSNHYTITSPAMVYAAKLFRFEEGWYRFQYDWLAYGESNYDYLRVALVPASVTLSAGTSAPTGFSYSSLPSGWIALDGGQQLSMNAWWQTTFSEINVPAGDYMMVFAWRNDNSMGSQPPAAIDNVSIRPVSCLAPVGLTAQHVGRTQVTLDWTPVGNEDEWEVWLSWPNGNETWSMSYTATTHPFTISGLGAGVTYTATVNAKCGPDNTSYASNEISFTTSTDPCDNPATFPFSENFDGYAGSTSASVNILPDCWSRINTTTVSSQQGYPTIFQGSYAQSAPNFLYFMSTYAVGYFEDPQDQYAILPPMDHMADLVLSLYARIPVEGRNATFMVGVMTDPEDASTFTELATLQPTSTTYTHYSIPLGNYTGNGWYIAIKMPAASSSVNYRGLCIDDVAVDHVITFADPAVKALCVASSTGWDTNGDSELSYAEAEAVTSLDGVFSSEAITSFNELQYFTGLEYLDDDAFYWCDQLTSVIIPSSVTEIGGSAFSDCSSLTSVTIPSSVTYIGESAFSDCSSLTSVTIPSSVTSIGSNAFSGSGLTEMTVEATTPPTLGNNAFQNVPTGIPVYVPCNTKAAYQAASGWSDFTNIIDLCDAIVFADANVKAICVDNWDTNGDGELSYGEAAAVTSLGDVFDSNNTITSFNELQYFTGLTSIINGAFYDCEQLTSVIIPHGVVTIENHAFRGCINLVNVTLPTTLREIEISFQYCSALTTIDLPEGLIKIQDLCFSHCNSLTSIFIPASTTQIYDNPFAFCPSLASIVVHEDNQRYTSGDNCNAIIAKNTHRLKTGCKNTSIPDDVVFIGEGAFWGCTSLTSVIIPNSVTEIEAAAFSNCYGLTSVIISSSVNAILEGAFDNCSNLEEITVLADDPPTLGLYSSSSVFYEVPTNIPVYVPCGRKTDYQNAQGWNGFTNYHEMCEAIVFADANVKAICVQHWDTNGDGELSYGEAAAVTELGSVFWYKPITSFDELQYFTGLTSIGSSAFYECSSLVSITIPSSVTTIDGSIFHGCSSLVSITIPSSVTTINGYPFTACTALVSITVEAGNTVFDSRDNCNAIIETSTNTLKAGCKATVIPNTVTTIRGSAFAYCYSLTSIEIPNSVTTIGNGAFYECTGLYSITIPSSVTQIQQHAFKGCTGLTSITVEATSPPSIFFNVFQDVPTGIPVYVPCGTKAAYQAAAGWSDFINIIDLCDAIVFADANVKAICVDNWDTNGDGELSYAEAAAVTSLGQVFQNAFQAEGTIVTFDELQYFTGLTSINDNAFAGCWRLSSITLPPHVEAIGNNAFGMCSALTSITLPNTVTSIGYNAFQYCMNLTTIEFPDALTTIGSRTFDYCLGLTSVEIPAAVTSIGLNPFTGCNNLASITVAEGNTVYSSPNNNALVETATHKLVSGLNNTVIPDDIQIIGNFAFNGLYGLTSLVIPASVTDIYYEAFGNCSNLAELTVLATTPPTLGNNAFFNVPTTIPVYVPCGTKAAYQAAAGWNAFTNFVDPCDVIVFADPSVKALCVANWDTNGDGELSYDEAAAVTDLNPTGNYNTSPFYNNQIITSFNELQYFTGLTGGGTNHAFRNCSNLASVTLPDNLEKIGTYAFNNCTSLSSITLPDGVTEIGMSAFSNTNLTSITLPTSLRIIGAYAFSGTGITSVYIPATVNAIGSGYSNSNIFYNCTALESIVVDAGNPYYDSRDNCNAIIRKSNNELISGCMNTVIPSTVTAIRDYAFYGCIGLTSITIPGNVTSIGTYVFYNCTSLTSLTVEATTPPTLGSNVFQRVSLSIPVNVPCESLEAYQTYNNGQPWGGFTNIRCDVCTAELPLSENFDSYQGTTSGATNVLPDCWDRINTAVDIAYTGYPTILNEPANAYSGSNYLRFHYNQGYGSEQYVILPYVDDIAEVSLWFYAKALTENAAIFVGVMTDPNDVSTFETAFEIDNLTSDYQQCNVSIDPEYINDQTHYIAIKSGANYGATQCDLCIDNLELLRMTQQNLTLAEGWNWWTPTVRTYRSVLQYALGSNGIIINTQNQGFQKYNGNYWSGTLPGILEPGQMYKIKTNAAVSATLQGLEVNQPTITIVAGYNWFGYTGTQAADIATALGSLGVSPTDGDIITDKDGHTATYNGNYWSGTLTTLQPGHGYVYRRQ